MAARWLPLAAVLVIALFVRLPFVADAGYPGDLLHSAYWLRVIEDHGVFHFYEPELRFGAWDRAYPPLSTLSFEAMRLLYGSAADPRAVFADSHFLMLHKLLPVAADLVLIAAVGLWLVGQGAGARSRLRWLIPGALALAPGLMATSAWWGQYESVFTVFMVLALLCLNRDRPLLAWLLFAAAVLIKQPALILGPVLLVVTFRRYGWRRTVSGLMASGALCAAVTAPFALGSGLMNALSPYLKASDAFPYLTNNAYNGWYALGTLLRGTAPVFHNWLFSDAAPLIGAVTAKQTGLLLFGAFVLLMMALAWQQAHARREFVWAAVLSLGFFMLPTQVHERYLYLAVVFALIGIAQDRRLWPIALGLVVTYTINVAAVLLPARGVELALALGSPALLVSLANAALFVWLTCCALRLPFQRALHSSRAGSSADTPHSGRELSVQP